MRFSAPRPCEPGECPYAIDGCAHPDRHVDIDVDELTAAELATFWTRGSDEQRAEILDWLASECSAEELLAGQRDAPELRA